MTNNQRCVLHKLARGRGAAAAYVFRGYSLCGPCVSGICETDSEASMTSWIQGALEGRLP